MVKASASFLHQLLFSRSTCLTLIICWFLVWIPVEGNYQLIGSPEPILVAPGDDVILPCRVDPDWNAMEKTVEWSRPDLKASGPQKRVEYVYVHRFRRMDRDMMMETYIQRTSLSEGLRHGDVSLRIHNVSLEDSGRFRCFIPNLSIEAEVLLIVDPNFVKMTTTETAPHITLITPTPEEETIRTAGRSRLPFFFPLSFFIIFVSFLIYRLKTSNFQKNPPNQVSALQSGCLAQGQICIDVDLNLIKSSCLQLFKSSDSIQQQQQQHPEDPGDGHSLHHQYR